jgi:hypothetical protein
MNEAERNAGLSATPQYRYADRLGSQLFVAGQVPLDAHGDLVGAHDAGAQALQCLRNLSGCSQCTNFKSKTFGNWWCTWSETKQVSLRHGQQSQLGLVVKFHQRPCSVSPDWVTQDNL